MASLTYVGGEAIETTKGMYSLDFSSPFAVFEETVSTLLARINCTDRNISLTTLTNADRSILITFSTPDHGATRITSLPCWLRLRSQPPYVLSAVLLEHTLCDGGVFVLLLDRSRSRQWDVCAVWHAPGPDFLSLSPLVIIRFNLIDVSDPCNFTIHVRAMDKPVKGELEKKYLLSTEGKSVCVSFLSS